MVYCIVEVNIIQGERRELKPEWILQSTFNVDKTVFYVMLHTKIIMSIFRACG